MNFFSGKTAWITGASSGIGEALAYALAANCAQLILSARRMEELERVKANIPGDRVAILLLDLEDTASFADKVKEAMARFGSIDIMIHNGGISQRSEAKDTPLGIHRRVMDIDYFSYIELTRLLLPHMQEKQSGHIVAVSSVMGKIGTPRRSAYAAAKHALHGYFDCLRAEVHSSNIKVTVIMPGYIRTNVTRNALNAAGEKINREGKNIAGGYPPDKTAQQILTAIAKGKFEKYVGRPFSKEWMAIHMMRLFPSTTIKILRNAVPD